MRVITEGSESNAPTLPLFALIHERWEDEFCELRHYGGRQEGCKKLRLYPRTAKLSNTWAQANWINADVVTIGAGEHDRDGSAACPYRWGSCPFSGLQVERERSWNPSLATPNRSHRSLWHSARPSNSSASRRCPSSTSGNARKRRWMRPQTDGLPLASRPEHVPDSVGDGPVGHPRPAAPVALVPLPGQVLLEFPPQRSRKAKVVHLGLTPNERTTSAYATAVSSIVACSYSDGLR